MTRANLKIAVGTYVGNLTAHTNIDIGFEPHVVLQKRTAGSSPVLFVHRKMPYGKHGFMTSSSEATGQFKNFSSNGFVLDAGTTSNQSGVLSHYIAIGGSPEVLSVNSYVGTGADNRNFIDTEQMNFTPNFVFIKNASTASSVIRTVGFHAGDLSGSFDTTTESVDRIQNLQANGFQLGTISMVNGSSATYRYIAMLTDSSFYAESTFTGNGTSTSFTLPFVPDCMFIKPVSASNFGTMWFKNSPGTTYTMNSNADLTDAILGYTETVSSVSRGCTFSVGSNVRVNENGVVTRIYAFKAGEYNIPFNRIAT